MERTDYRFWIQREDADAPTQMYPLNFGNCYYQHEKKYNWNFSRRKFKGDLIFVDSDYDYFKTEYDETDACYQYDLIIERKCDGLWVVDFLGYFALNKGKFNFERCKYSVEPVLSDKYDCILKNIDVKLNIANRGTRYNISYAFPEETITFAYCMDIFSVLVNMKSTLCGWGGTWDSDFFKNATNPVTGQANKLNHLLIGLKSDFIYNVDSHGAHTPPSGRATKGELTLGQMFDILYNIFQVKWSLNDDEDLIFTHESEITSAAGINLTVDPYLKTTAYQKELEWDRDNLFRYEKWTFMESANQDFTGEPIEYNEKCAKDSENNMKEYSIPNVTTDIQYIYDIPERISPDGFVLLVTDGLNILSEEGIISGDTYPNAHLSTANLHYNYWRHNRIFSDGEMNGFETNFLSTQKIKKIKDLTIITCCDLEFDMMDLVTTELGQGEVIDAIFYPLSSKLTLKIMV